MEILKRIIRSWIFWIIIFLVIGVISLYNIGFRITYAPHLETSWTAVSAVGQWFGVLVAIAIPIAVIYLQNMLNSSQKDIGEANAELYNEFKDFKKEYEKKLKILSELVDENGDINFDGGTWNEDPVRNLKEEALKFINISMITNTKSVAEHLQITKEEAYQLLLEMIRHDGIISCGGYLDESNKDNIVWLKKSKK